MGLCKCRVVTTLFCFQHRVNVCETCLVNEHEKCVVKTYLAWLQDSDFDATCKLCRENVDNGKPVVRLTCLDLFHWDCLDAYAKTNFPAHTAPAGYTCPSCKAGVVPADNNASLVAKALRERLRLTTWGTVPAAPTTAPAATSATTTSTVAQTAFSSTLTQSASTTHTHYIAADGSTQGGPNEAEHADTRLAAAAGASVPATPLRALDASTRRPPPPSALATPIGGEGGIISRKGLPPASVSLDMDADDNKYARRPANAWFARLVGNRIPVRKVQQDTTASLKRTAVILVLLVIGFITLIELLTRVRPSGENDPLLDPDMNPHIQVESR
eukprot:m.71001 g.71001  ORF g.71001 m.71001 type:complete len:329 (-) comp14336_c0_seq1:1006-1992(-)